MVDARSSRMSPEEKKRIKKNEIGRLKSVQKLELEKKEKAREK